ncbi:hypothetical protein BJ944DRAFT_170920 [Cunninghamella echinulata]|nr:hypothetical protein BJ944DRAFT_170920 [Cunninghamella echinulata]
MSVHPFDIPPTDNNNNVISTTNIIDEPIAEQSAFFPPLNDQPPLFNRSVSPTPDNIVRAASPQGRRYLKPVNGIQIKGFARSAQRRSSVLTLGSIERLQHFYAKKDLVVNKVGTLGFKYSEEPDELDQLPTPKMPPPSWKELDVETDLDVLLQTCFQDIQQTLTAWAMVTGPRMSISDHSVDSDISDATNSSHTSFHILPLLQSVTRMLTSVKTYTINRHDLSNEALTQLRQAALALLSDMKDLETNYRLDEDQQQQLQKDEDVQQTGGYIYKSSDFHHLEKERKAIQNYLSSVEKFALNPPHHIGAPPTSFTNEIKALLVKNAMDVNSSSSSSSSSTTSTSSTITTKDVDDDENNNNSNSISSKKNNIPNWLERSTFPNDDIGKIKTFFKRK